MKLIDFHANNQIKFIVISLEILLLDPPCLDVQSPQPDFEGLD